jgi:D-arabinose 1-dehydrogenase-like Zn-dependent alcohol dehydrogenase
LTKSLLGPFPIERGEPGTNEVLIDIIYCGVCYSDIHHARDEWGSSIFLVVPGHEIVGRVSKVGAQVKNRRWETPLASAVSLIGAVSAKPARRVKSNIAMKEQKC